MSSVPSIRIRSVNEAQPRADASHVLYWMTSFRRLDWNFALERAVDLARDAGLPLVILEALRSDHRWASDRFHRFVLDGMAEHDRRLEGTRTLYWPYVEPSAGAGRGLLRALARTARAVVTDDHPGFFVPRMIEAAGRSLDVRLEAVDSNGLFPLRAADRTFTRAHSFRRFLQKHLRPHLEQLPREHPLSGDPLAGPFRMPEEIARRWPRAERSLLDRGSDLSSLPIDHDVAPTDERGGAEAARARLTAFVEERLSRYGEERNQPERDAASGLSPWLHFGHLSAHETFAAVAHHEGWTPSDLSRSTDGSRSGWWGMGADAEAFLDELVTWREIGFNMSARHEDHDRYESLPDWARKTLEEHESDEREHVYGLDDFEAGRTHDPLWNAAQGQLRREGRIHNYLRMLWGKKILEWTASPREALDVMIELNNRWALDGRDPNSTSGIFWVLGRYDRAWGPERPIFGKIRYMSSENTARKVRVRDYVREYAS
jgi:deoxyribodipyrimidine photo-lyase